ncbi:TPA: hypothetical protein ACX6QG_002819 [Photobacterium damselae]
MKNWQVIKEHERNSDDFIVMYAYVDTGGSNSYHTLTGSEIEENQYTGLENKTLTNCLRVIHNAWHFRYVWTLLNRAL